MDQDPLVSTDWLAAHLAAPDVRVVDASWHFPQTGRDGRAEYREAHIPGAVFFDVDDIADTNAGLPHMLPSPEKFSSRVRRLGLGDGNRIVVYDTGGVHAAARAWWMFRVFGHRDVVVLDGGLPKWRAEGRPIEDIPPIPRERHFTARIHQVMVRDRDQIRDNLASHAEQVVDARGPGRFEGTEPEPRTNVRSGHIPDSLNVHYADLFNDDETYKDTDGLRAVFQTAGVDLSRPIVTSCGSGLTACVLALALNRLGHQSVAVYDGSWAEWGGLADMPVETGPAALERA